MEENKVYTFEFRYFDPDYNIGTSVQFCAEDIEEAKDLFSDYLLENYSGVKSCLLLWESCIMVKIMMPTASLTACLLTMTTHGLIFRRCMGFDTSN